MLDFEPFYLTLKLAITTTVVLFIAGVPVSYWLAFSQSRFKVLLHAFISLPLVLPPTVLGFYLLLAFSPDNTIGKFLESVFDVRLVFSFTGLVIASVIYSLPFMIQPIHSGFLSVPKNLIEASYTLGKSKMTTIVRVLLPNMRNSLFTGCILSFAHTIGEFGVVLMVGGNIPGETRVISVAIYGEVEAMNYYNANVYAAILLGFSFLVLVLVYTINHNIINTSPGRS
jgi:molybdate transport system permease protein